MKYHFICQNEDSAIDALQMFDPSVIAIFRFNKSVRRDEAVGVSEAVLDRLERLIPVTESIEGFFLVHGSTLGISDSEYGSWFALALREIHDPSYFNRDAVETLRWAIRKAKRDLGYGKQVSEACWTLASGSKAIAQLRSALASREDDSIFKLYSQAYDYNLRFYPISDNAIDNGEIGEVARFMGVYPGNSYTGRSDHMVSTQLTE